MPRPVLSIVFIVLITGCAGDGPIATLTDAPLPQTAHPFDPVLLRIHALTHVDPVGPPSAPDQALLVLHFELKDRYADTVKGLGGLKVELYKPGEGMSPGIESQSTLWDLPEFADPEENSARLDVATSTYRVPLAAERWIDEWLNPEDTRIRGGAPAWLKVRATLSTRDAEGRLLLLSDEYVVQR